MDLEDFDTLDYMSPDGYRHGINLRLGLGEVSVSPHECRNPKHAEGGFEKILMLYVDYINFTDENSEVETLTLLVDPCTQMHRALVSGQLAEISHKLLT